jgi:hypothetical protein
MKKHEVYKYVRNGTVVPALIGLFVGVLAYGEDCFCRYAAQTDSCLPCTTPCTLNTPNGATNCTFHTSDMYFECNADWHDAAWTKCVPGEKKNGSICTYTGMCGVVGVQSTCMPSGPPVVSVTNLTVFTTGPCVGS